MVKDDTLYKSLEIETNASAGDIKKAYNRLSKIWHPDKHSQSDDSKQTEAKEKFQAINQAKEILSDPEKREFYDNHGLEADMNNQSGFDGFPFGEGGFSFGGGGFPFGMPGMQRQQQQQQENIIQEINVTLEQLYNEASMDVNYKYKQVCAKCSGEGTKNCKKSKCMQCDGKGVKINIIKRGPMMQQTVGNCNFCKGTGVFIEDNNKCDVCTGTRYIIKDKKISIPLKSELSHGSRISLEGKGHQLKNIKTDLILSINVLEHDKFKRLNNDLFITIELKLYQALFGFNKIINHLDGRKLHINHSGKTEFNCTRKIVGEGLKKKGDIYIKFIYTLPNISSESKKLLKPILQGIDKHEVQSENVILKIPDLVTTKLADCNVDHLYKILDGNKQDNRHNSQHDSSQQFFEQETSPQQQQCQQS